MGKSKTLLALFLLSAIFVPPAGHHSRDSTFDYSSDSKLIIVGGRRQFSYEFYPKDSRHSSLENYQLDFLHGNLLLFTNRRSVLLNYAAIREFPPIPGGDPRNYPGSSLLLSPHLIAQDCHVAEAEIIVCGGYSPHGSFGEAQNGTFARAVNTCYRLIVTDPHGTWTVENMPVNMLHLPIGDLLIIKCARNGTAGWGLTQDPRLYHSSAVLIPDRRILVGGSNPQVFCNFSGVEYPTDLSLK